MSSFISTLISLRASSRSDAETLASSQCSAELARQRPKSVEAVHSELVAHITADPWCATFSVPVGVWTLPAASAPGYVEFFTSMLTSYLRDLYAPEGFRVNILRSATADSSLQLDAFVECTIADVAPVTTQEPVPIVPNFYIPQPLVPAEFVIEDPVVVEEQQQPMVEDESSA